MDKIMLNLFGNKWAVKRIRKILSLMKSRNEKFLLKMSRIDTDNWQYKQTVKDGELIDEIDNSLEELLDK